MDNFNNIFIMGQCTLHWGRMEFGNIGNFYIADPFFRELRKNFPDSVIRTTMQFSDRFCKKYNIETVPMEYYYDFGKADNLDTAKKEWDAVKKNEKGFVSDYVAEVQKSDLVIDFSGDIWGDNADFLGSDRFETGLYKDLIAQHLKPTVMLAGSPGPFSNHKNLELAKVVFKGFCLVTNREPVSTRLLKKQGFDVSRVVDSACPSFLFESSSKERVCNLLKAEEGWEKEKGKIGFILCGWNFKKGPFDLWPREDNEYEHFAETIKNMVDEFHVEVYLMSHSNGFRVSPEPFELIHGRDYPIAVQLKSILDKQGYGSYVKLIEGIYLPEDMKGIIGELDMLVSGRMHGAVAGISQCIPTVMIDYGHPPKAHKLLGFAEVTGLEDYIVDPNDFDKLLGKVRACWRNRKSVKKHLENIMPTIKKTACHQFNMLKELQIGDDE